MDNGIAAFGWLSVSGCLDGWWILCTTPFPLCTYILGMETLTQLLSSDSEYDYEHDVNVNVRFYRYFFHLFKYLPHNAKLCSTQTKPAQCLSPPIPTSDAETHPRATGARSC